MCKKLTTEEFIENAVKVHGDMYDYSKVEYVRGDKKVNIICNSCGDTFQISPNNHTNKKGCKSCGIKRRTKAISLTTEDFINRSTIKHNGKYDYSNVNYINCELKVSIWCPEHKEYFEQKAMTHLNGCGCPKCALEIDTYRRSHYIKLAEKATLYLIKIYNEHEVFYKLGKTIGKTKRRFAGNKKLPYEFTVINEYSSEIGEIFDLEIILHRKYKNFQYFPKINFKGYTECYTMQLPINEIINLECQKE